MTVATAATPVKHMIAGGKSTLTTYIVQGWLRGAVEKKGLAYVERPRLPLSRPESIKAVSPLEAARAYARSHQVREALWNDGTPRPFCIIRVTEPGQPGYVQRTP